MYFVMHFGYRLYYKKIYSSGFSNCEGLWQKSNSRSGNSSVAWITSVIEMNRCESHLLSPIRNQDLFFSSEYLSGASTSMEVFTDLFHSFHGRNIHVHERPSCDSDRPEGDQFIIRRPRLRIRFPSEAQKHFSEA